MAYFNHAFQQTFVPTTGTIAAGTASSALNSLQLAMLSAETYQSILAAGLTANTKLLFGMGSPMKGAGLSDTIGGNKFHGGYQESWKSKIIVPKYVRFIGHMPDVAAVQPSAVVTSAAPADNGCWDCDDVLAGGYYKAMRIDLKGSPVLRALNRNHYKVVQFDGYCNCTAGGYLNPAVVYAEWAKQIVNDPITFDLIDVKVEHDQAAGSFTTLIDTAAGTGGATVEAINATLDAYIGTAFVATTAYLGRLTITPKASLETTFSDATFDSRDFYGKQPMEIFAEFLDREGDPCEESCSTVVETKGTQAETKGETLLRDSLMFDRYKQNYYHQGNKDAVRMNEIEQMGVSNYGITRSALYDVFYVLHTVPRFNNPTGVFDNDQYLIKIGVLGTNTGLRDLIDADLDALSNVAGLGGTVTDMSSTFLPTEGFSAP